MEACNIVWFKRDLRLSDHRPLMEAIREGLPTLLIYVFEPSLIRYPKYDIRHWRFVWESLVDLNNQLAPLGLRLYVFHLSSEVTLEGHVRRAVDYRARAVFVQMSGNRPDSDFEVAEKVLNEAIDADPGGYFNSDGSSTHPGYDPESGGSLIYG